MVTEAPEIEYLYGLERFGVKLGLDVMHQLMDVLDHPEKKFKSVHITGTTGKGSTASFLANILQAAGYSVGLYTSPHIYAFNERVRINNEPISDTRLKELIARIRTLSEAQGIQQTFFEFTTALAFEYFAQEQVDIAIVEVGFGGTLDATNVITPEVSVITKVGLDHTKVLGDTKEKIAQDKAGIIKPDAAVVTNERDENIVAILRARAAEVNAGDFYRVPDVVQAQQLEHTLDGQLIALTGEFNGEVYTRMLGLHQIENICTAVSVALTLRGCGYAVEDQAIVRGIADTYWEGRLSVVSRNPLVIIDGAHNIDGMEALASFTADLPRRDVLILGFKSDKDFHSIAQHIVPQFERVIVTQGSYEPADALEIARELKSFEKPVEVILDPADALKAGLTIAGADGTVVVTGSLYMVADVLSVSRDIL